VYIDTLYLKCKKVKNKNVKKQTTQSVHMCVLFGIDKDCDLLHDRPVLSTGRMPHDKQNRICLDCNRNLVRVPEGLNAKAYWLTVSCQITLTLTF